MSEAIRMRKLLDGEPAPYNAPRFSLLPVSQARPEELHALLEAAYADGGGSVAPLEVWWPSLTTDTEYDPELLLIVADRSGTPIGLSQSWTSGFLKDLVVAPAWRNRQLGGWLLHRTFDLFRGRGAKQLDLKVEASNIGARRFYIRHGMVEIA